MRKIFVAFDDTDNLDGPYGTGKVARWFLDGLPEGLKAWGVVRQQLLVHPDVPFTSHNSAACIVLLDEGGYEEPGLVECAAEHLRRHALPGSDPGLCVASEVAYWACLEDFGRRAAGEVLSQKAAREAARGVHLSAHGGTGDGIIGALAAVGLTHQGWTGRYVEFGGLREIPQEVSVGELAARGIRVAPLDRDATVPREADRVLHEGWLRPRLLGGVPVLPVTPEGPGCWRFADPRRRVPDGGKAQR